MIEERAFEKCSLLFSVEFLADEIKVDGYVFGFCMNVSIISFPNAKKIDLAYDFIDPDYEHDSLITFTYLSANICYFTCKIYLLNYLFVFLNYFYLNSIICFFR